MNYVSYGSRRIAYRVKVGKRKKTVAISINPNAQVVISVPSFLTQEAVRDLVRKKARWIFSKQDYFKNTARLFPKKELVSGEELMFLGRRYRLKIKRLETKEAPLAAERTGRRILVTAPQDLGEEKRAIRDALIAWFVPEAEKIIQQRVKRYSVRLGIQPKEVIIKNQERRWGSCSKSGVVRLNWKIIMAPISVVDYVIVHELCHLRVTNHSQEFWNLVSSVLPDYELRRDWLKRIAPALRV